MRKIVLSLIAVMLLAGGAWTVSVQADHHEGSWSGEVIDLACYVAQGAKGEEHAGCAKGCVKGGQPMGLLTDDGTVVLLAADHKDGEPYEALKDMAGSMAMVKGALHERDGMKVVTVTGAKAAG